MTVVLGCGETDDAGGEDAQSHDALIQRGDAGPGPGVVPHRVGFITLIEGSPFNENGFGFEVAQADLQDTASVPRAERVAVDGDCAVYTHPAPGFCDPSCGDLYCTAEGTCVPFPRKTSAGDIEVTGLIDPLTFSSEPNGYALEPDERPPSNRIFDDGATIIATAPGDEVDGFTLTARGVSQLEAALSLRELRPGEAEHVTWVPENDGRVQVAFRNGWHGGPYTAGLICEVDDTGSLEIAPSMVDAYIDLAGSGQVHYWWIARFTRDVLDTEHGPVELFVANVAYQFQFD
jgi:hypothetical protein